MSDTSGGAVSQAGASPAVLRLPEPSGPGRGLPLRAFAAFRRDPLAFLERVHREHGDVSRWRFGPRRVYMLAHPELVREVMVTHHKNFIKSKALQRARVILGEGLLTSEGEHHLRQRRLAQPAFHRERIAALGETMVRYATETADGWRAGVEMDLPREMNRLTLAIAGKTLFGADVQAEADEIGHALTHALQSFKRLSNPLAPILDRLPLPSTLRVKRAGQRLNQTIYRIIAQRRASGEDRGDLLSMLLAARDEEGDGGGMTNLQLRDEALTIFLAGHETTANALSWTWHLLALNPDAEARLHAELAAVLAGRAPTADDVPRLPYTRAVFAEAMRLYPPAWAIGREPLEEFEAGGYRIRAGTVVLLSPWIVHRDPRWWTDPERFDPDRWSPEREAEQPRFAYFPFGGGPRKCIGEGFAWTEGILVLATLAQRWTLRHAPGAEVGRQPLITLRPTGLQMIATPR
ncbi:MAG TPA: cytochrome P450 [Longimicrobium sp.]|nr:cytochrome P450 [Longimicrobium sp.]